MRLVETWRIALNGGWKLMWWLGKIVALLAGIGLAACTNLPVGGPDYRAITLGATETAASARGTVVLDYVLLDINRRVLDYVATIGPESLFRTFGGGKKGPAPVIRVGVGDVVQVTIFESAAGGLFIPAEAGTRPGNFVTFPSRRSTARR
jgi:polysaccharide export outer membrane protein